MQLFFIKILITDKIIRQISCINYSCLQTRVLKMTNRKISRKYLKYLRLKTRERNVDFQVSIIHIVAKHDYKMHKCTTRSR